MLTPSPTVLVVDPALGRPELDCFNLISRLSPLPISYHLPAILGLESAYIAEQNCVVKGVVLLGSIANVEQMYAWQRPLTVWLERIFSRAIPLLGICYGHQLIAHMAGACVKDLGKKELGFRRGSINSLRSLENLESAEFFVTHNQAVVTAPREFSAVLSSPDFPYDGLQHQDKPIWTFQPHIETTPHFCELCRYPVTPQELKKLNAGHKILSSFLHFAKNN